MQKTGDSLTGLARDAEEEGGGLFLRLPGNNLEADNTRRSCNLAATPAPTTTPTESAWLVFIHFPARRRRDGGEWGEEQRANGGLGGGSSGVPRDNRRHHPRLPDPFPSPLRHIKP